MRLALKNVRKIKNKKYLLLKKFYVTSKMNIINKDKLQL
jgi:hypothetical protein